MGPTCHAKPYFEALGFAMPPNENPADWIMDVMSGQQEIENERIPNEAIPGRLFQEWEQHGAEVAMGKGTPFGLPKSPMRANSSKNEDAEVIKCHLKEAWRKVETTLTMPIGGDKLAKVLTMCTGVEPDEVVVDRLLTRIGNAAKNAWSSDNHVEGTTTHHEFEQYLLAIHKGGARLREMNTSTDLGIMEDEDEEDEQDDEDTENSDSGSSSDDDAEAQLTRRQRKDTDATSKSKRKVNSNRSTDLSRQLPGFWAQLRVVIHRRGIIWWRRQKYRLMFLMVVEFAAAFLAVFDRFIFEAPAWLPTNYMNAQISLALLTSVYMLGTFGSQNEMPVYWREVSHGLSRPAVFIGRSLVDVVDLFLMCFGFTTMYYVVSAPELSFTIYVVPFIFVTFVAAGWGYLISCWLPFELVSLGPFISALLSFVFGGILGLPTEMNVFLSNPFYEVLCGSIAFTRWGVPMEFFQYIKYHPPPMDSMDLRDQYMYRLTQQDYKIATLHLPGDDDYWWTGILALSLAGIFLRVGAFVGLCVTNRSKQV